MQFRMAEPDRFDWTLVRSFLAVLDAGSLLGAARRLNAQQPTLSRHVAQLEAQLGAPLFERTGRGVTPTALALSIAEPARQMAQGADALGQALAGARLRPLRREQLAQPPQLDFDDFANLRAPQWVEHNDFVDPVQEFGPEFVAYLL